MNIRFRNIHAADLPHFMDMLEVQVDGHPLGFVHIEKEEKDLAVSFDTRYVNEADLRMIIMRLTALLTARYHPERIIFAHPDEVLRKVLATNLYFAKGRKMVRITEPWRRMIKDTSFDEAGYLINQSLLSALPFGYFDTKRKGCGWIAAYNLMKMYGYECFMQETAVGLNKGTFLQGTLGVNVLHLYRYLKNGGLPVTLHFGTAEKMAHVMEQSSMGIVLYFHALGAHYTAYQKEEGLFHFYNSRYGKRNDRLTPSAFFKERTTLPFAYMIVIR